MVGKNPHRPEGKARDNEHMAPVAHDKGAPYEAPSSKEVHERDLEEMQRRGGPTTTPAFEQRGGSRPGVRSRMEEAEERLREKEEDEGGRH
jgi:hypothetical protein